MGQSEGEADECMKSTHLDVRVIGLLEMALSWIFRSNKDYSPVHCIERAQMVCQTINGNNKSFLLGRCEYLLSLYTFVIKETLTLHVSILKRQGITYSMWCQVRTSH